jgi:hypothetical protein
MADSLVQQRVRVKKQRREEKKALGLHNCPGEYNICTALAD